jgi:cation transport ATPase
MKTSHFTENYDLCHPLLGCENSNNISNNIANSNNHQQHSATFTTSTAVVTYGNNSVDQTKKFEKNANDFQIKQQQRQQQQEQNKKRKRETGEYSWKFKLLTLLNLLYFLFLFIFKFYIITFLLCSLLRISWCRVFLF